MIELGFALYLNHVWVGFVGSLLISEDYSPGSLGFLSPRNPGDWTKVESLVTKDSEVHNLLFLF